VLITNQPERSSTHPTRDSAALRRMTEYAAMAVNNQYGLYCGDQHQHVALRRIPVIGGAAQNSGKSQGS